jgi:AcrR family transcriptional regulator
MIFVNRPRKTDGPSSEPRSQGEETRETILAAALKVTAREGLAALTIGRLAKQLRMSKSGLFAHFHSRQALELATLEKARKVFADAVLRPVEASGRGVERLWNLCDLWLLHIELRVFSGAYFFTGALFEYADQSGPVAKAIKSAVQEWHNTLRKVIKDAQELREMDRAVRTKQVASELNSILVGAHWTYLLEGGNCCREARVALLGRMRQLATDAIPASAFESLATWKKHLRSKH